MSSTALLTGGSVGGGKPAFEKDFATPPSGAFEKPFAPFSPQPAEELAVGG